MDFKNKTVWITGASSGIGEALVKHFAQLQTNVILSSRRVDELARVQKDAKLTDQNSLLLPLDLSKPSSYSELVETATNKFGGIDILVNNGGVSQRSNAIDASTETERRIMEINYFGTIALTKAVLPKMIAKKSGNIIVLSSIAGKFGFYLRSSYSASKHALHGYFESLRMEVEKSGIGVLLVCPGKVKTNISKSALKGDGSEHNKMDESQEKGVSAEECAAQIVSALSKGKKEIYIGDTKGKTALLLKRLFPNIFYSIIKKQKPE